MNNDIDYPPNCKLPEEVHHPENYLDKTTASTPSIKSTVGHRRKRRHFTPDYKARIVEEAIACRKPGQITALLQREKLHSSALSLWRNQYQSGAVEAFESTKLLKLEENHIHKHIERMLQENERLRKMVEDAELIITIQIQQIRRARQFNINSMELQERLVSTIEHFGTHIEVGCLCRALDISRATFYRKRKHSSSS